MDERKVYEPGVFLGELVTSLDEVKQNVKQFNEDLENELDIVTQLTMFKHWYYITELDLFGPSKFIGYKNMNSSRYNRGKGKTGVHTEEVLKEWFIKIPHDEGIGTELMGKLATMLSTYEKRVRSNAQIHFLKYTCLL
ncbi:hypothetical protein [Bacillus fonticola]|uniref:hypothetical protein n=1 Tax=Bacillus fonticola TaxID=2728853 RepID=UPI001473F7C8|nr:hypothetical protein [Bacillus fonticola]